MYLKSLIVIACVGSAWALCPPAEEQLPCECDEARLRFYCGNVVGNFTGWDIKAYFDRISTFIDSDAIFEDILITTTELVEIPAGAMQTIKFKKIHLEYNFDLEFIHPDAFGETTNVTTYLSIILNNRLDRLWNVITKFKAADTILIHQNNIRSIPDEGFGPLPNLKTFRLGWSQLERVGSRALSQLPNLEYAELGSCDISLSEIADDAFEGVGPNAEIGMTYNQFSRLPEVPFKTLLDNGRGISVGGRQCQWVCIDVKLDCDEVSEWMCSDVDKYQPKVRGFLCKETRYNDIWDYCAQKVNNN